MSKGNVNSMKKDDSRPVAAVAGCIGVDICPRFVSTGEDFGDLIKEGKITHVEGNDVFPGGAIANTGIAMELFGVDVRLCGRIGMDGFGSLLMELLSRELGESNTNTLAVSEGSDTAYSLILAPEGLDRAILQNPGANHDFDIEDIRWDSLGDCRLMHFGHPPTLKRFYEEGGRQLVELFEKSRETGMVTSLDLCVVDPASDAGRVDWKGLLGNVLPYVDFFLPSRDELAYMLLGEDYEAKDVDSDELIAMSQELGATNVLVKEGARGMTYRNGEDFSDIERKLGFEAGSMDDWRSARGHVDAVPIEKEVSGLGAGDTSIGAYLAALMRGYSFEDSLYLSRMEGALCVSDPSATAALLPFEEVLSRR